MKTLAIVRDLALILVSLLISVTLVVGWKALFDIADAVGNSTSETPAVDLFDPTPGPAPSECLGELPC